MDCDYTPRQQAILEGNVELSNIRSTELAAIVNKATARKDTFNLEIAQDLLTAKQQPTTYVPQMTTEEAHQILQKLTPWELDY
jgi:hypothetical protein